MVLCLLSRDSHGDTTKLNHEETVRGPEIAIFPGKSEILLLILVKILKKSDSSHSSRSSSKGAVNAYFLTGSFSKKTWLFEAVVFLGQSEDGTEPGCEVSRRVKPAVLIRKLLSLALHRVPSPYPPVPGTPSGKKIKPWLGGWGGVV